MVTILLTAGVVALLAAALGGGLKALLPSRVRTALAALAIALLIASVLVPEDPAAQLRRYQRQIQATCNIMRDLPNKGIVLDRTAADGTFDRSAVIAAMRNTWQTSNRRLKLDLDKPAPESLRDEAQLARKRADTWIRRSSAVVKVFADALPAHPTGLHLFGAQVSLANRWEPAIAPLEGALTRLSGHRCRLRE